MKALLKAFKTEIAPTREQKEKLSAQLVLPDFYTISTLPIIKNCTGCISVAC